jgi:hypothetical protein
VTAPGYSVLAKVFAQMVGTLAVVTLAPVNEAPS